jgi:GT2 family glycosyltransferase
MNENENPRRGHSEAPMPPRRAFQDLTVVIPSLGRPLLRGCLRSIARGTVWPASIIVVDQGDNPEAAVWLNDLAVTGLKTSHLPSAGRSPASARNRGMEQARTTFLAFIDDDCLAESDWLEKMEIRLLQNPGSIVTGRLESSSKGIPPTLITSKTPRLHTRPSIGRMSPLASANMAFALLTARRIGPFDEKLLAAEENDWAYRALRVGIPILYAPEIVAYHIPWRDNSRLAATYRLYARTQGAFFGKHLRRGDWSMLLAAGISLIRGGRGLLAGILHNDHDRRAKGLAKLILLLPGLAAGWRGRNSSDLNARAIDGHNGP